MQNLEKLFDRRKRRVRYDIRRKANGKPRLSVSVPTHISMCRVIDDLNGRTVAAASTRKGICSPG